MYYVFYFFQLPSLKQKHKRKKVYVNLTSLDTQYYFLKVTLFAVYRVLFLVFLLCIYINLYFSYILMHSHTYTHHGIKNITPVFYTLCCTIGFHLYCEHFPLLVHMNMIVFFVYRLLFHTMHILC